MLELQVFFEDTSQILTCSNCCSMVSFHIVEIIEVLRIVSFFFEIATAQKKENPSWKTSASCEVCMCACAREEYFRLIPKN